MFYVDPEDVLNKFIRYLQNYDSDMISKDTAIDELRDALDDAEFEVIEGIE